MKTKLKPTTSKSGAAIESATAAANAGAAGVAPIEGYYKGDDFDGGFGSSSPWIELLVPLLLLPVLVLLLLKTTKKMTTNSITGAVAAAEQLQLQQRQQQPQQQQQQQQQQQFQFNCSSRTF